MTDEQRSVRLGRNEALFRGVNERVRELNEGFAQITKTFEIVCECSESTCVERLLLRPAEYEHVRERAEAFIVLPEHVARGVERVSEDHGHYLVVEKLAEAAEVARETNPRN